MDEFVYDPLPTPTSIRLLRRQGKTESGLLNFSLITVDLKDDPTYHCLSYTWGNPHSNGTGFQEYFQAQAPEYAADRQYPVLCNGKILNIGTNLVDAMIELPTDSFRRDICERDILDGNSTQLHVAARDGQCELLRVHIQNGVDASAQDSFGNTPLHVAALYNQVDAACILLDGGADPFVRDNHQKRPVTYASQNRSIEMTLLLVRWMSWKARMALIRAGQNADDLIWIDSICINQKDVKERSSQVSAMHTIYRRAEFVLVWLGNEDPSIELAIDTIFKLGSAKGAFDSDETFPHPVPFREVCRAAGVPYISIKAWNALARLFTRQWFRRIWVIQEVVAAAGIIMYCGRYKIRFDLCAMICDLLEQWYLKTGRYPSTYYLISDAQTFSIEYFLQVMSELRIQRIIQLQRDIRNERIKNEVNENLESSFSLPNLIEATLPFLATDPRDKIYALLPLSTLNPRTKYLQFPDYSVDVETCYMYATLEILLNSEDFAVLSWVQDQSLNRRPRLPSWVPDYSLPELNTTAWRRHKTFTGKPREPLFFRILKLLEKPDLGITGYDFDKITRVGIPREFDSSKKFKLDPTWIELCMALDVKYHTGQSRTEALWRTLCSDATEDNHPAPLELKDSFIRLVCAMVCANAENHVDSCSDSFSDSWKRFGDSIMTMPCGDENDAEERLKLHCEYQVLSNVLFLSDTENNDSSSAESHIPSLAEIESYFQNRPDIAPQGDGSQLRNGYTPSVLSESLNPFGLAYSLSYRESRLFVTQGQYIGVGPVSMQNGDKVFLLPGSKAPFIFRARSEQVKTRDSRRRFSLVGEAYVHGIMHGEAMVRHPELKEKFEEVYLI